MSRYIDADAFFETFGELNTQPYNNFLTADVVEVVRCKECIHMGTDKCPSRLNDADFYCCQGERRENVHYCAFIDGPCSGDFYCAAAIKRKVLGGDKH